MLHGGDFYYFLGKFGVVICIISEEGNNTTQGIIPFQKVVFYGEGDFVKYKSMRINNLKHFQNIYVLIQDILG